MSKFELQDKIEEILNSILKVRAVSDSIFNECFEGLQPDVTAYKAGYETLSILANVENDYLYAVKLGLEEVLESFRNCEVIA